MKLKDFISVSCKKGFRDVKLSLSWESHGVSVSFGCMASSIPDMLMGWEEAIINYIGMNVNTILLGIEWRDQYE